MPAFRIRFWGVRGSIPAPGPRTARYGGNTSCIEVDAGGEPIILDAGTGIREYGLALGPNSSRTLHILITHTHWDHIQGLPFFIPMYRPDYTVYIYGPEPLPIDPEEKVTLEWAVIHQFQYQFFPVRGKELNSTRIVHELGQGEYTIAGVRVRTKAMNHTIPVLAYRLERDGRSLIYTGDNEPEHDPLFDPSSTDTKIQAITRAVLERRQSVIEFLRGADLLIADAQYTDEEYEEKREWGHCSVTHAVDYAVRAGVRRLVLFHHEPTHDDDMLDRMLDDARRKVRAAGASVEVLMAREGMVLEV
jgi:phosphoribosyl 1,2-cyclic phosphodiesterase